jgi:hypothetical protein
MVIEQFGPAPADQALYLRSRISRIEAHLGSTVLIFFLGAQATSWSIAHTFTTNNVEKLVCSVQPTEDPKRTSSRTLLEKGIKLARAMAV